MTSSTDPIPPPRSRLPLWLLVLPACVLLQLLLVLNPGFYSHDELQWGAQADVGSLAQMAWVRWSDTAVFQWRPLTFNGWLLLSHYLFRHPQAMHLAWVLMGSGIAAALGQLLLRLRAPRPAAAVAAIVFALGPYAAFVHGWVATLADLLWVALALVLAHVLHRLQAQGRSGVPAMIAGFVCTALALLAKEAALAIPALLVLAALLWRPQRVLAWAAAGAAIAGIAYLALRLPVLLAPAEASTYVMTPAELPRNWLTYHLFAVRPTGLEAHALWLRPSQSLWLGGLVWLGVWVATLRADRRLGVALLVGGALALGPTLLLPFAANQYAYGFSAWTAACLALAWPALRWPGRVLVLLVALATVWHGVNVQREMRAVGERQAVFQPALVQAAAADGELRLYAPARYGWLYQRLTHDVSVWRGQAVRSTVVWVDSAEDAQYVVADDGHLESGSETLSHPAEETPVPE